jgi:uncharacterized protein YjbI with pentapeptide repeats
VIGKGYPRRPPAASDAMGREPRRKTAREIIAACQRGDRNFRGEDLSGLDLRGADLRGADFRGANLRGACLAGCQLGSTFRWQVARQTICIFIGLLSAALSTMVAFLVKPLFYTEDMTIDLRLLGGAIPPAVILMVAWRGFRFAVTTVTIALLAVVAAFVVFALASTATDINIDGTPAFFGTASSIVSSASIAFSVVAIIGAGANVTCFAVTFSATVTIATIFALGLTHDDDAVRTFPFVFASIGLPILSLFMHRRALSGDPRDAWLRIFALWLSGLGGTRFAGADLSDADLSLTYAAGADLRRAHLVHTIFRHARDLHLARFHGPIQAVPVQHLVSGLPTSATDLARQDLTSLALDGVNLQGANLRGCVLKDARLAGAHLDQACLERADLCGAELRNVGLQNVALRGARIDILTYQRSEWVPDNLAWLLDQGVEVVGLNGFPEEAQNRLSGEKEGLTLYFSTRLTRIDKMLVEGVIVGVLGRETKCHSEYLVQGEAAIVRLFDAPREDLERVAEALHQRAWEQAQAEQKALVRMPEALPHAALREGLSDLMGRKLERIELREAPLTPGPAILRWRWENPGEPDANSLLGPRPCRLFLLYAPRDGELAAELVGHLTPLVGQKLIDPFDETRLLGGDVADELLAAHLESADAVVVLVSSALFQDGPWHDRLGRALVRQKDGVRVIPVLARPVSWDGEELAQLQPLPEDRRPVMSWPDRDEAWVCVVSGLRRALLNQARG